MTFNNGYIMFYTCMTIIIHLLNIINIAYDKIKRKVSIMDNSLIMSIAHAILNSLPFSSHARSKLYHATRCEN